MVEASNFKQTEEPVPAAEDGQAVVKVLYVSLDPAMRGWMNEGVSYVPPVELGDVMRALGAGVVVEANGGNGIAEGDHVVGLFGVKEYAVAPVQGLTKVDADMAPLPTYLGALGMPGLTAYFGLLDVGDMREGDTVVISGAAGAVGMVAGQIAKIKGAGKVVGIAGGPEKCSFLTDELGFDAAIDYKSDNVGKALKEHCPDGIDVYFDNVGGEILDNVLARLARGARIVICGAISQYNAEGGKMRGPSNYMMLLVRRARMQGFVVFDYADRYGEAVGEMAGWRADGTLKTREDVVEGGIDDFVDTLLKLFRGENLGKLVLKLADG
jgi:NADPH-dependent curcumin reductase CurA